MNMREKFTWDTWNLNDVLYVGKGLGFNLLTKINYM